MGDIRCGHVFDTSVAKRQHVDICKEILPGAEQDRRDGNMHLVYQSRAQILPDRGYATAQPDIQPVCRDGGAPQCAEDAVGDEVKSSAAFHGDGLAGMVSQHKDLRVIRRIIAPPASPFGVRPRAAYRPEHVAAHDPCAYVAESARGKVVVDARCAAGIPEHLLESSGREGPLMQGQPSSA